MRAKRVLAMVLSVALIATSGNFTLDTYAAEDSVAESMVEMPAAEFYAEGTADGTKDGSETHAGEEEGPDTPVSPTPPVIQSDYFALTADRTLTWKEGVSEATLKANTIVELPAETWKIPAGIFSRNSKIVGVNIPENSELKEIAEGAFERSSVKSLILPDSLTTIGAYAFKGSEIQRVEFGTNSKLTFIGKEAFADSKLVSFRMPGMMTEISESTFKGCQDLQSVSLVNVEIIGEDAFRNCTLLEVIAWGSNMKEIRSAAFSGCGFQKIELNNAAGASVETWGSSVFEKCISLSKVELPDNMKSIPGSMFRDCTALSYVDIPKECVVIGNQAFSGCTAIKEITIPEKVSRIESAAFAGCQNLTDVVINQQGPDDSGESDIILAEDAFPQKTMNMTGYDGTVEDYADRKGYKFISLIPARKIKVSVNDTDCGQVSLSKKTAKKSEEIEVTVTPAEGYRLKAATFTFNGEEITKLKETTDTSQVFTFIMPDKDVTINVDFEKTSVSYGTLSAGFRPSDPQMIYSWDKKEKLLTLDKVGFACQLVVQSSKGASYNPGIWMFDYSSKNTKIAAISSDGVIYARGTGTTTITAKLKSDTSKTVSFQVCVVAESGIDQYKLEFSNLNKGKLTQEVIDGKVFSVIQYTKGNLSKAEKTFDVKLKATAGNDPTGLFVLSSWKVNNEDMIYLDKEQAFNNKNKVHINKGITGETSATVTVTNGKTGKDKVVLYEESFIIRVVDVTPRLIQNTLTVNANCTVGTNFDLLSVYGYEVIDTGLQVVRAVKNGKITEYEPLEYVTVRCTDGKFYLDLTTEGKNALKKKGSSITYSNMYIQGDYSYDTNSGVATEVFRTPIKSLVLTTKSLKPSVKTSGKVNLFFNSAAEVSEKGAVTVTQSLKNLKVTKYELVSAANYEKAGSEVVDSFANNFIIDDQGVITRNSNELIFDEKGKVVSSGYLKITYEGYEPCFAKISVPTENRKPAYVLSKTKATVNSFSRGYAVELRLLDKKTKNPLSLGSLNALSFDESSKGTTTGLFEDMDTEAAKASDVITLQIKRAQKGKAVINVEMATWNEPMKFTFNLNVTSASPVAKAKTATLTLNNLCVGREATTPVTINQDGVKLVALENINYTGKPGLASEASRISFNYADGVLSAVASDQLTAGSYKFGMTPVVQYSNGETGRLKNLNITVKVTSSKLTASLKPSTVSLNNGYVGNEVAETSYTIKNMPAGEDVVISDSKVVVSGANASAEAVKDAFAFDFASDSTKIAVSMTKEVYKAASYRFKISGLATVVDGEEVEIQPFNITVKVLNKSAKLTVKASGTLNCGNNKSSIVYTLIPSYVGAPIENVIVKELNTTNGLNKPYEELENFQTAGYGVDEKGYFKSVAIMAKDGVTLNAKTTYKIRIGVVLKGSTADSIIWSSDIVIRPKQTLPKIKTDVTSTTLYAGAAMNSPMRSQEILITKTTEQSAVISDVFVAKSNVENLQKAFKVTFDPTTQKAKLILLRPDLLVTNTEYTLTLEVRVSGQMVNTVGPRFNIQVKIME